MRAAVSLTLLAWLAAAAPARAQSASLDELPPMDLGHVPSFPSEAAAHRQCPYDAVIWFDPATGYFYPHAHPKFGRTPSGGYACMRDALRAKYWDINPFANNPERGREFPIDPSLLDSGV